jgi:hypothetical protein
VDKLSAQVSWGRVGGLTAHSRHTSDEMLAGARAGFRRRFELAVDPAGTLDPAERERRATAAMRAHMTRLALRRHSRPNAKAAPVIVSPGAALEARRDRAEHPSES